MQHKGKEQKNLVKKKEKVNNMTFENTTDIVEKTARQWLKDRGISLMDIADLVYFLQKRYHPDLKMETCLYNVEKVLAKREVQNAIITGIHLDTLAEKGQLEEPLLTMLRTDEGLYGVDEVLAFSIVNVYGSIGFTNYGYIDKMKPGILKKLNDKTSGRCHTFLDDIIGAIAAAASSRLAHQAKDAE